MLFSAERLLKVICEIFPRHFEVYKTPDSEITIDAPYDGGQSVLLLCEPDGGMLRLANMGAGHNYKKLRAADALSDRFLRESLSALEHEDNFDREVV